MTLSIDRVKRDVQLAWAAGFIARTTTTTEGGMKKRDIDDVKGSVHIDDLLLYYGVDFNIDRTGWQSVRCVFHDDSRKSASVNLDLDKFFCHGCQVSGDVIDVASEVESLSIGETISWLSETFIPS
jgi:DNA primase